MNAPSPETILVISRILGARPTPPGEIASVIAAVAAGVEAIGGASAIAPPSPPAEIKVRATRKPRRERIETVPEVTIIPPRKRGRPRLVRVEREAVVATPEPDIEPPQPKLLRRARMPVPEPTLSGLPMTAPKPGGTIRGVVKWFDGKAGKGALRLTGISGDVALETAVLQRAGIRRLYKDQEIEATIQQSGDRVRLVDLALPGRVAAPQNPFRANGEVTGVVRRQPRQVMVEVKRDGSRQRLARAEAEQVLGSSSAGATVRLPRRPS